MRILFVVHHFPPDVNSTGILFSQITADLVQRGHKVTVLTTFPHYEEFRTWPEYRRKVFGEERHDGVEVLRVWSYTSGKKSMVPRLINYLTFNLLAMIRSIWAGPTDVIFCTNGSFFSGVTGRFLNLTKRAPFVFNLQDLYPEVPIRAGQLTNGPAIRILRGIASYMYRKASRIAVITPSFKEAIVAGGIPVGKVDVIPNFVDVDFIKPLPRENEFARAHGLLDRFVISHAGNIGYVYDLPTLLEAADRLRDRTEVLFAIIGDGVAKEALERQARDLDLDNVLFLPFQPREYLPYIRSSSDVQVALYRKGAASESMPSKVYEIMASGRPVLASAEEGSDLRELVTSTGCGLCVSPENVEELVNAIVRLADDPTLREESSRRGREEAMRTYQRKVIVDRYEALFRELLPARTGDRPSS